MVYCSKVRQPTLPNSDCSQKQLVGTYLPYDIGYYIFRSHPCWVFVTSSSSIFQTSNLFGRFGFKFVNNRYLVFRRAHTTVRQPHATLWHFTPKIAIKMLFISCAFCIKSTHIIQSIINAAAATNKRNLYSRYRLLYNI